MVGNTRRVYNYFYLQNKNKKKAYFAHTRKLPLAKPTIQISKWAHTRTENSHGKKVKIKLENLLYILLLFLYIFFVYLFFSFFPLRKNIIELRTITTTKMQ